MKTMRPLRMIPLLVGVLVGCQGQHAVEGDVGQARAALTDPNLSYQRDRLLASLGQVPGGQFYGNWDACSVWRAMDQSQRYEFLMFTDSLGQRSPFNNDWSGGQALAHVNRLLWVWGSCPAGTHWVKGPGTDGYCYWNGSNYYYGAHECGTESANRLFAEYDDPLIQYVRNYNNGLPTWGSCADSPHKGFNNCSEQHPPGGSLNYGLDAGGQMQFLNWPTDPDSCLDGRTLWNRLWYERGLGFANNGAPYGCYGYNYAPYWANRVVEFDVDFDATHESSTTCYYGNGYYGNTKYNTGWNNIVTYNDADYDYNPCTSPAVNGATYCVDAPENSTATLSCPWGVINSITFASYGQPDTFTCGSNWAGWCSASNSYSVVQSSCLYRQSCTINVSNSTFGDPCMGVVKKLGVQYTCG